MEEHLIEIFYGGHFLSENNGGDIVYLGGAKHEMAVKVSPFVLSGLHNTIQELLGNKKVIKVHFRK